MSKRLMVAMMVGTAVACTAAISSARAETPYTPPPLFGAAPVKIAPAPAVVPAQDKPINESGTAALKDSASVAERVENPVQVVAPINTEFLLDHPADRITERAQAALKRPKVISSKIPDFATYDDTSKAPDPTAGPISKPVDDKPKAAKKPKAKPTVKSIETGKAKVLVLSRDPKTGDFKRSDTGETIEKADTIITKTSQPKSAPPPPPPGDIVKSKKKTMPAVPPSTVETISLGMIDTTKDAELTPEEKVLATTVPPLPDNVDLSDKLLASNDTSLKANNAPALPLALSGQPNEGLMGNQHVLLLFKPGLTELGEDLKGAIGENVLPKLNKNPGLRVEIRAYASPNDDTQSSDRRISLARGLAVREYLRSQGIDSNRMDVRALGRNTDREPFDRVDVVLLQDGEPL